MFITRQFIEEEAQIKCDLEIHVLEVKRKEVEIVCTLLTPGNSRVTLATPWIRKLKVGDTITMDGLSASLEFKEG